MMASAREKGKRDREREKGKGKKGKGKGGNGPRIVIVIAIAQPVRARDERQLRISYSTEYGALYQRLDYYTSYSRAHSLASL